jgi:phage tail tape-measure protein
MLKRLESEDLRLQNLVSTGELTRQAVKLAVQQLNRSRDELLAELRMLEPDNPA